VNGGHAEYAIAAAPYVGHLPARSDFFAMALILCAGVTTYMGIKETEPKPGEWIVISGIGALGHVAVQSAKAMGLHVAAVDVTDDKLALATRLGADLVPNAATEDVVTKVMKGTNGGAHGVLVSVVSTSAFGQAIEMTRRRGTVSLVGLPPGEFPTPIFDVVLKRINVRGSIVGTRKDLSEAIAFAKVKTTVSERRLDEINDIFAEMKEGQIEGRIVLSQL
jgi:propanol-preferring alcohol dehydrogenase